MPAVAIRILVVGPASPSTNGVLTRLARHGWGHHSVENLREAQTLLGTFQFDVILAAENLPDGHGYELMDAVARSSASLLVSIALSESCLWLPVVERGSRVLGERALNLAMLELELEVLLASTATETARAALRTTLEKTKRPGLKRAIPPRRKTGTAGTGPGLE